MLTLVCLLMGHVNLEKLQNLARFSRFPPVMCYTISLFMLS